MPERITYITSACTHCGGGIEYGVEYLGKVTTCPHCGKATLLSGAARPEPGAMGKLLRRNPILWTCIMGGSGIITVLLVVWAYSALLESRAGEAGRKVAEEAAKRTPHDRVIRELGELEPALDVRIKEERFHQLVGGLFAGLEVQPLPEGAEYEALLQRIRRSSDRAARCFTFRKMWTERFGGDPTNEKTPDPDGSCADYREGFKTELKLLRAAASELRDKLVEVEPKHPSDGNPSLSGGAPTDSDSGASRAREPSPYEMPIETQRKVFDEAVKVAGDPRFRQQTAVGSVNDEQLSMRMMLGAPPGRQPAADEGNLTAEQRKALKDLELSYEETADLKAWLAAGMPRYWRGKKRFPSFTEEDWESFRKAVKGRAEDFGVQVPVGVR
jgi:hypothetical protein